MDLHDWSRVPDNVFHSFHYAWLYNLAGLLNDGALPEGYVARPEEYVGAYQSDVLALETEAGGSPVPEGGAPTPVLTLSPPLLALRKQRRLAVYSARDERRIAVIEIVSPGNKDAAAKAGHFRRKVVDLLENGIHVVILDVLPATSACRRGFAADVARELGAAEDPPIPERCAASFEVVLDPLRLSLYARALEPGRALPEDVPLFLAASRSIPLPLGASYRRAVEWLPATDRALL